MNAEKQKARFGELFAFLRSMQTDLAEMMEKLVEYMEIVIDNILEKVMKALPEVSYLIVGVVLIFFVLVVLAPCIQTYMGGFLFESAGISI